MKEVFMWTKDQAAELANKVRWAIGSTAGNNGSAFSCPYYLQRDLASLLAGDVVNVLTVIEKERLAEKGRIPRKMVRNLLTQVTHTE